MDAHHDHTLPLVAGIINLPLVHKHPDLVGAADDKVVCPVCNRPCWIRRYVEQFADMHPDAAMVCCECGQVGLGRLRELFGDRLRVQTSPVPNLAALGLFN